MAAPSAAVPSQESTPEEATQPDAAGSTEAKPAQRSPKSTKPKPKQPKHEQPAAAPKPSTTAAQASPAPAASAAKTATLDMTFTAGVLKGEYWLKVDGQTVAHETIDRKFSLKKGSWSKSVKVSPGGHTVSFELATDIVDIKSHHEERAEFASGETRSLQISISRFKKEIEFEWN